MRARLSKLEAAGATGVIFGTSGADVERELHAFARLVDLETLSNLVSTSAGMPI